MPRGLHIGVRELKRAFYPLQKLFLLCVMLIVGASCQIYTQVGPDGYKYPKPQARFNLPEPLEEVEQPIDEPEPIIEERLPEIVEEACANGGSGDFCCTNGADNVDCCDNGGKGQYCCKNNANNVDCCENDGSGPFCCTNGADNEDCCENGGKGQYCCTNGLDNPDCALAVPPPLPAFIPQINLPQIIPVQPKTIPQVENIDVRVNDDYLPPLPVAPAPAVPKALPVKPTIVASTPRPFVPAAPVIQARIAGTTKSPNEYLPPFDVRAGFTPDWDSWKIKYSKSYPTQQEDNKRHSIFDDNVQRISVHNVNYEAGMVAFDLDVNKFADLTQDEFEVIHTGLMRDRRMADGHNTMNVFMPSPMLEMDVEDEVDWRKKGAVTPVKNQGKCASCWAFAANGALEAQNFLKTGKLVSLSEQNLIDCVKTNDGCDGGYMTNAYDYVRTNPGVDTESSYPYEARSTSCRFNPSNIGGECMAHMEIMIGNEKALKQAVATVGPVAAGIDGAKHSFQFYKSGFYFEPTCDKEVNHAVTIVGYGKTDEGQEYWICKNSWDTDWGEEGYIRMARNKNNHCGITTLASYPLV